MVHILRTGGLRTIKSHLDLKTRCVPTGGLCSNHAEEMNGSLHENNDRLQQPLDVVQIPRRITRGGDASTLGVAKCVNTDEDGWPRCKPTDKTERH